jgi:hypothetical protein
MNVKWPYADILPYDQKADIVNKVVDSIFWFSPVLNSDLGEVAPWANYLRNGVLAYADGTNWNPLGDGVRRFFYYDVTTASWIPIATRSKNVTTQTGSTYTITTANDVVVCNRTTAMTVNLPSASATGNIYTIKNINTGTVTIDGNSSDTIDGLDTQTLGQWDSVTVMDYYANKWGIL